MLWTKQPLQQKLMNYKAQDECKVKTHRVVVKESLLHFHTAPLKPEQEKAPGRTQELL